MLRFEPYAPVRRQLLNLLRTVNRTRKRAGFEPLPVECLRLKRRIYRPFEDRYTGEAAQCRGLSAGVIQRQEGPERSRQTRCLACFAMGGALSCGSRIGIGSLGGRDGEPGAWQCDVSDRTLRLGSEAVAPHRNYQNRQAQDDRARVWHAHAGRGRVEIIEAKDDHAHRGRATPGGRMAASLTRGRTRSVQEGRSPPRVKDGPGRQWGRQV